MIKSLRSLKRKFIVTNMLIAVAILLVVFATLFITTTENMRQQSEFMLVSSIENFRAFRSGDDARFDDENVPKNDKMQQGIEPDNNRFFENSRLNKQPVFTVFVSNNGEIELDNRGFFTVNDENITTMLDYAMSYSETSGTITDLLVRFASSQESDGVYYAFSDMSAELNTKRTLILNSLLVGAIALIIFFIISILLARWAIKPVEKAWKQQQQFVGDASHELKTPLTVILSNVDMLSSQPEKGAKWTENIKAEALRMKTLIEEMLCLARSDNKANIIYETVNFSYILNDVILLFEPIAFEMNKSLEYDVEDMLFVSGNTNKLKQLIEILIDNAIKYSYENQVIEINLKRIGKNLSLTVKNIGDSLTEDQLSHIFERFYRADDSRSCISGHGLGLAIAKEIIKEHKGKIQAFSQDGKTCFEVIMALIDNRKNEEK